MARPFPRKNLSNSQHAQSSRSPFPGISRTPAQTRLRVWLASFRAWLLDLLPRRARALQRGGGWMLELGAWMLLVHLFTRAIQFPSHRPSRDAAIASAHAISRPRRSKGTFHRGYVSLQNRYRQSPNPSRYPQWFFVAKNQFSAEWLIRNAEKNHCVIRNRKMNTVPASSTITQSRSQPRPCPIPCRTKSMPNAGTTSSNGKGSATKCFTGL